MALTMAQNSLFAILLRSSWWLSVIIGLLLIAASLLIAGGKYLIVGITAALPFLGIGAYSAYQQLQRPSSNRVIEVVEQARSMPAADVARRIATAYEAERYSTEVFKPDGADLVMTRGGRVIVLSTKRFKAANTGIEPLKKLITAGQKAEAGGHLYVTLGEVSDTARKYARDNYIDLIDAEALAALFDQKAKIS